MSHKHKNSERDVCFESRDPSESASRELKANCIWFWYIAFSFLQLPPRSSGQVFHVSMTTLNMCQLKEGCCQNQRNGHQGFDIGRAWNRLQVHPPPSMFVVLVWDTFCEWKPRVIVLFISWKFESSEDSDNSLFKGNSFKCPLVINSGVARCQYPVCGLVSKQNAGTDSKFIFTEMLFSQKVTIVCFYSCFVNSFAWHIHGRGSIFALDGPQCECFEAGICYSTRRPSLLHCFGMRLKRRGIELMPEWLVLVIVAMYWSLCATDISSWKEEKHRSLC